MLFNFKPVPSSRLVRALLLWLASSLAEQNGPLSNPRLPVRNEYLAGWALTQNNTDCLNRLQGIGYYKLPELSGRSSTRSPDIPAPSEETRDRGEGELWGEATRALLHRVDVVHDRDQRRLAASRYWQHLQVHRDLWSTFTVSHERLERQNWRASSCTSESMAPHLYI